MDANANAWTLANKLTAVSVGVAAISAVIAFASLGQSWLAQRSALRAQQTVEAWRVETGHLTTDSNGDLNGAWANPWSQWVEPISEKVMYIGVQKRITFAKPFRRKPSVSTALSLIQLPRLDAALAALGYHETDRAAADGLRQLQVETFVGDVTEANFTLYAGVGLPVKAGRYLEHELSTAAVDSGVVARMRNTRQVDPKTILPLSPDDRWMINFYMLVGTIDASWIAQAPQEK